MSRRGVTAFVIGAVLMIFGAALFVGALALGNWDFKALSTEEYETNTYVIEEEFSAISVNADTADIAFVPSEDGKGRVVCDERIKLKHSVTAEDGTLTVKPVDNRKWYDHITLLSFGNDKITVYLPKSEYESLYIRNDTGDVDVPNAFKFGTVDIVLSTGDVKLCASASGDIRIKVSTGKVSLADLSCGSLYSVGDTGDITLKNVIASGAFIIERSTGDIRFDACDAASVKIETDTGDVKGTFLTDKIFAAKSDTGSIKVPVSAVGGLCEIETDTGDIKIEIRK